MPQRTVKTSIADLKRIGGAFGWQLDGRAPQVRAGFLESLDWERRNPPGTPGTEEVQRLLVRG